MTAAHPSTAWPLLTSDTKAAMAGVCIGAYICIYILLRKIWIPPPKGTKFEEIKKGKGGKYKLPELAQPLSAAGAATASPNPMKSSYGSVQQTEPSDGAKGKPAGRQLDAGQVAGDYSAPWTSTFDAVFLGIMIGVFAINAIITSLYLPALWSDYAFWLGQLPKVAIMMLISLLGGAICRYFCTLDDEGYILTNRSSKFKVNYTRKLQHFAAYLVPLLVHLSPSPVVAANPQWASLFLAWGQLFTLAAFLVLIKPLRERSTFLMVQFNSMDRPEDRPNTMKWLIGGNIIPGTFLIVLFTHLYAPTGQQGLAMIFVFITGLGDGLAEPVGITWGRHKYRTTACCSKDKFTRSWEGSACVFLSGMIFPCTFYQSFANETQMWMAIAILPAIMAYAEATAPHTMDTPVLMGLGGAILLGISKYHPGVAR